MPLNKYAAWGAEPTPARPAGLGAITRQGFAALYTSLEKGLPGPTPAPAPSTPGPSTPSATGLRVLWSLGPVRDALMDQGRPTLASCNQQLDTQLGSKAVQEVGSFLQQEYHDLYDPYLLQFRPLSSAVQSFELERRERLAELAAVEWEIMATVEDLRPTPTGSPSPSAKRSRRARTQP